MGVAEETNVELDPRRSRAGLVPNTHTSPAVVPGFKTKKGRMEKLILIRCHSHRARKSLAFLGMLNLYSFNREGEFYLVTPSELARILPHKGITKARWKVDDLGVAWSSREGPDPRHEKARLRLQQAERQS